VAEEREGAFVGAAGLELGREAALPRSAWVL
jgi:hypothetical protein